MPHTLPSFLHLLLNRIHSIDLSCLQKTDQSFELSRLLGYPCQTTWHPTSSAALGNPSQYVSWHHNFDRIPFDTLLPQDQHVDLGRTIPRDPFQLDQLRQGHVYSVIA